MEVNNASEFYVEVDGAKKPDVPQNPKPLTGNIEIGALYSVKFSVDEQFYRGKVLKETGPNKYHVQYIDYGNYESVQKSSIYLLPENLRNVKSPLYRCSLYGIDSISEEGLHIIKDHLNVELTA